MRIKQLLLLLLMSPGLAMASDARLSAAVTQLIASTVDREDAQIVVNIPLSSQLANCKAPQPYLPRGISEFSSRVTLGIKCSNKTDVYLQTNVEITVNHAVAITNIERGVLINSAMLTYQSALLSDLPRNVMLSTEDIIGKEATRRITSSLAIRETDIKAPELVSRGDRVEVVANGTGFVIKQSGIAQSPGSVGETIRVVLDTRQTIQGRVVGKGQLETAQ